MSILLGTKRFTGKIGFSACMLVLCCTIGICAAPRKKSRVQSNDSTSASASIGMAQKQQSPPVDTAHKRLPAVKDTEAALSALPVSSIADSHDTKSAYAPQAAALDKEGFVKPGEAIRIYAFPDTGAFVNGFYPVDGEGRIYLPIIGKMNVMNMTEKAFLDTLKAQYINYLRYPNLQIRHNIRISLLGGFQRPGLYYIDPDYSIWDAVYLAGGTTREDGLKRMQWERDREAVTKDIIPYYQSGQSLRTIGFQSGDQLWTPVEPKRNQWEVVVRDILLSQVFPIITTSASLYMSYLMYKSYKSRPY